MYNQDKLVKAILEHIREEQRKEEQKKKGWRGFIALLFAFWQSLSLRVGASSLSALGRAAAAKLGAVGYSAISAAIGGGLMALYMTFMQPQQSVDHKQSVDHTQSVDHPQSLDHAQYLARRAMNIGRRASIEAQFPGRTGGGALLARCMARPPVSSPIDNNEIPASHAPQSSATKRRVTLSNDASVGIGNAARRALGKGRDGE